MAKTNGTPETVVAQRESQELAEYCENHEPARKKAEKKRYTPRTKKGEGISKPLRSMSVSYVNVRHYDRKTERTKCYTKNASLRLNGTWMEEAGFTTGTKLDVRVMPGCLVITARPTLTPLMQVLNKTSELPEAEQQQVMAFLQGVMARVELEKR